MTLKILSLGAGVQSTTLLLMSLKGELPKLDHAIFADTGLEPKAVYEHLERLKVECKKAGLPLHVVNNGDLRADNIAAKTSEESYNGRWAALPLYVMQKGKLTEGKIRRQCTGEYKITPIERKVRILAGYKPRQRIPVGTVEQWIGISTDEKQRARVSDKRWLDFHYPLILDKKMSRQGCYRWLENNWPYLVPKSACIGCPFHGDAEWREMRDSNPDEWADAVEFDAAIRTSADMFGKCYLHRSCKPLDEVDLNTAEDEGQLDMWNQECMGMCGV